MLNVLLRQPGTNQDLVAETHISEPSVSRHLAVLQRGQVITGVRKGNAVYFFVREPGFVRQILEHRL